MNHPRIRLIVVAAGMVGLLAGCRSRPAAPEAAARPVLRTAPATQPDATLDAIRDEGLNRSQAMTTLDYLCNVIGPRLTGSPGALQANQWTRDKLTEWGLSNATLEEWGPFGRGWTLQRFSMQVVEPNTIIINALPKAWSPGLDAPIAAEIVHVDAKTEAELEPFKGTLKGKIVLLGSTRDVEARFEPLATRLSEAELNELATAEPGSNGMSLTLGQPQPRTMTRSERQAQLAESGALGERLMRRRERSAGARPPADPATSPATRPGRGRGDPFSSRALQFAHDEGAILVATPSSRGDGGTFFVQGASIPGETTPQRSTTQQSTTQLTATQASTTSAPATASAPPTTLPARPRVWEKSAPPIPPQVGMAIEDYNRLARMIKLGITPRAEVDLRVQFHEETEMAFNTIAEIPGTDLKDEIVMVGGHLDSWHGGTGATDNAIGAVAAMEAVRIIKALDLKPRRTIRVALWTGEEQGLYGSAAYVKKHFASDPDAETRRDYQRAQRMIERGEIVDAAQIGAPTTVPTTRRLDKLPDYEKLSAYYNLDNGTGKIRGIHAQANAAAVPLFREWLAYVDDLGADTVTLSNTGSTDHMSFDAVGLPGFQFIQDQIEYSSRTHHSNMDVYDRLQPADVKQAATVMAIFLWRTANMDERLPRKTLND